MKPISAHALGYVWHSNVSAPVKLLMRKTIVTRQKKITGAPFQAVNTEEIAVFIFLFCIVTSLCDDMCKYVVINDVEITIIQSSQHSLAH